MPRRRSLRRAVRLAFFASLAAGCGQDGVGAQSATTAAPAGSSAPPPDAAAPAPIPAPPSVSAAVPPPPRPPADRPSARFQRPAGIPAARWQKMFDVYGRLLDVDDILDDYHHRYPEQTEIVQLATTHQGRNVRAMLIADRAAEARGRPSMLLNGAHHGDEPLSAAVVLDAIDTLLTRSSSDPRIRRYLSELAIWCVPMVNPDGFATFLLDFGAGRKNGRETDGKGKSRTLRTRGVDLNRNYPFRWGALREAGSRSKSEFRSYRGPEPASEPETRAMVALSDREHFVGSISFHTGTVALLAPYTIDGVDSPLPNEAWRVAEHVADTLTANGERPVYVLRNLYPVDGTDQDYHRAAHGTVALLFEAAHRSWDSPALVEKALAGVRPSWGRLFDRYLDGPSVEGHVRDAAGRPVAAEVRVAEVKTRAGEVWKSRCPDGFFGRYLPAPGRFTVRVVPDGGAPIDTPVEAVPGHARAVVDIVVPEGAAPPCSPAKE